MRTVALAGPKGGIGKTTLAVTLSRALASRNRRVLVVSNGAEISDAGMMLEVSSDLGAGAVHTPVDNVDFLWCRSAEIDRDFAQRHAGYDDIVFDLNSGFESESMRIFLMSSYPVVVASSESSSIAMAGLWIRRCFETFSRDRLRDIFRKWEGEWQFEEIAARFPEVVPSFVEAVRGFRCGFLLNWRREQNEIYQSRALCHAWGMKYGVDVRFVGSLATDERRWFFARNLSDVSPLQREDPMVRDWDGIARTQLEASLFEDLDCLATVDAQTQGNRFLGVKSADEARTAYRILWEGYRRERGFVSSVLPRDVITRVIAQLEVAYRRADDVPRYGESSNLPRVVESNSVRVGESSNSVRLGNSSIMPRVVESSKWGQKVESNSVRVGESSNSVRVGDSVFPWMRSGGVVEKSPRDLAGSWLEKKRLEAGKTVDQVSMRTRISPKIVERLERGDIETLSTSRLRAYLEEIARELGLSQAEVMKRFGL